MYGLYLGTVRISHPLPPSTNLTAAANDGALERHCRTDRIWMRGDLLAHYALEFNHFYTTLQATGVPNFANENHTLFGADILISLSDLLGDMVLLYRCWLVWGQNYWIIILPSLTAIAGFACLMEVMHLLLSINPTAPVAPASIVPLGIAGYALPLCTNVMTTALIAGRIWWSTRTHGQPVLRSTKRATNGAMAIVVESGLLYLVTQLIFVVLFAIKHPAQAIVAVIAVQIYGIAPTLISSASRLGSRRNRL
ncbi:hypothetical protein A0H81_12649 [Grifola frondosa]|uniref:Uncharacterized protein n=1 Tax=Grifola frondosa TaxID=5627 RepID=A0A1C7LS25_GRIFR|nr:hypothetical protein A0H81_12649 [Grifola frondosa]